MSNIVLILLAITAPAFNAEENIFEPVVPESCEKDGYCLDENIPYPLEHVQNLIPSIQSVVDTFEVKNLTEASHVATRRQNEPEIDFCRNKIQVVYPKIALDEDKVWWYIINVIPATQGWRTELCIDAGQECNYPLLVEPGHKGTCAQKSIPQKMHAVDREGKHVEKELLMPHSCYCKIRSE